MNKTIRPDIFGHFDSPMDETPTHDPGLDKICPICAERLSRPLKTISLKKRGDSKSYFYRAHKECYESVSSEDITSLESSLIDNI